MLVLSRKQCETIRVFVPPSDTTQAIEICVAAIRGSKVQIGVEAGDKVKILRGEVVDREEVA